MLPPRPEKIDIALLYEDYTPFAYAQLVQRLDLIFGEEHNVGLGHHQDGVMGIIKIGPICAMISQNPTALGPEGFAGALSSPFNNKNCPEAKHRVQSHRKNIFITVGSVDILTAGVREHDVVKRISSVLGEDVFKPVIPQKEAFSDWLFVARLVCSQVMAIAKPTLIHWCQSDQLFRPDQIDSMADPRGMKLQIHPNLFSSGHDAAGDQLIGYHAFGSEHLSGYHVIVQETPLLFAEVRLAVDDFIYELSRSKSQPVDGQVLRLNSGATLKVHLKEPDKTFARQYISLEVLDIGDGVAEAAVSKQTRKDAFDDLIKGKSKTTAPKAKAKSKTFFQTITGKSLVVLGVLIVFGFAKGVLVLAALFAWKKYQSAGNVRHT